MKKIKKIKKIKKAIDGIKKVVDNKKSDPQPIILLPSGSTTLNLECSGSIDGAYQIGKMTNIIGDSSSSKSQLMLTMFAECSKLAQFDDYKFIYDDTEAANEFDIATLFGENVKKRIEAPKVIDENDVFSKTIEDFNDNVAHALESDEPFIYVLDSFDALTSEAFVSKDEDNRQQRDKGNKIKGSYGDGKAKIFSDFCKNRIQDLKKKQSALIIISQTRDNIGFGAMFTPKTRAGGKALKFYACHEIWLAKQKTEKKGKRVVTTQIQAKITKNKLTGNHGEAFFPVLRDYGVDDITSCINFLIDEGPWKGPKNKINTKGFVEDTISQLKLIDFIEENNKEFELRQICQDAFLDVMHELKPLRKQKYIKENENGS